MGGAERSPFLLMPPGVFRGPWGSSKGVSGGSKPTLATPTLAKGVLVVSKVFLGAFGFFVWVFSFVFSSVGVCVCLWEGGG